MTRTIKVDVAVVGAGIAGLWLLNRLRQAGYSALLLEKNHIGGGQTIASQGMIHGGLKYALAGSLSGESEAIKAMPDIWQQCLAGSGEINLSATRILSDDFYLWSAGGLGGKLVSFFASKALRGRVEKLDKKAFPAPFAGSSYKGRMYRLVDVVLDLSSLLTNLAAPHRDYIIHTPNPHWDHDGEQLHAVTSDDVRIEAKRFVITAGEGAGQLLQSLGLSQPAMQLRPLQQVLVKHDLPYDLYGHCIGAQASASPRLTISSHHCADGKRVWYLGGDLATEGVDKSATELIAHAQRELAAIFPWLDFSQAEWATLYINRAEPAQAQLLKPDNAFAEIARPLGNVIIGWPTKLTLAPDLTQRVMALLHGLPASPGTGLDSLASLAKPDIAPPPWETLFT